MNELDSIHKEFLLREAQSLLNFARMNTERSHYTSINMRDALSVIKEESPYKPEIWKGPRSLEALPCISAETL